MFRRLLVKLIYMLAPKEMLELNMWRLKFMEYRKWLSEFPEICMTMDNMMAEIDQVELLNVSYPPGNKGPWDVAGLREILRNRRDSAANKDKLQYGGIRVVCAANMTSRQVLVTGVRHYDALMHANKERMRIPDIEWTTCRQGFLDNRGNFLTRKEAWVVAARAKQILHYCGGQAESDLYRSDIELYSENLY